MAESGGNSGQPLLFGCGCDGPGCTCQAGDLFAAIDLGTNNCRLLIAKPGPGGVVTVVDAFSRIVRLGEGVHRTKMLSQAAMDRTVEALAVCAEKMRRRSVSGGRFVATEACRRARNGEAFLQRVRRETGIVLDVISAEEEATLAVSGCAPLLDEKCSHALVFDIGGGSTELIWLKICPGGAPDMLGWTSLPFGVVSLSERYGGRDPDAKDYEAMVSDVQSRLGAFEAEHGIRAAFAEGAAHMLGISGTVTTMAAVSLGLPRYDRSKVDGAWLSDDEVLRVSKKLASMAYADRVAHPCIRKSRADLVVSGCAAMDAMLREWPADRIRVADRGLREGILLKLMQASSVAQAHATA
jgi:exopolyphosphatase/guanosine-5'-triphosphate,3'-diphosphate pyrophosphatase